MTGSDTTGAQSKRWNFAAVAQEELEALYASHPKASAAELYRMLAKVAPPDELPSPRSVNRWLDWRRELDASEPWGLNPSAPHEAAALLPVLAEVIRRTGGGRSSLTASEAQWAFALKTVAPDLDAWRTYLAARAYIKRRIANEPTLDLDMLIARAPWRRSGAGFGIYAVEVVGGLYPPAPSYLLAAPAPDDGGWRGRAQRMAQEWLESDRGHEVVADWMSAGIPEERARRRLTELYAGHIANMLGELAETAVFDREQMTELLVGCVACTCALIARDGLAKSSPDNDPGPVTCGDAALFFGATMAAFDAQWPHAPALARDRVKAWLLEAMPRARTAATSGREGDHG